MQVLITFHRKVVRSNFVFIVIYNRKNEKLRKTKTKRQN